MKTLKILFAAIIFVGLSSSAVGQTTDNDNLTATAVILSDIAVTQENDLEFGQLFPDETSDIARTSDDAGRFLVDAADGANVTLTLSGLGDLELNGETTTTLPTTFRAGWAKDNAYSTDPVDWSDTNDVLTIEGTPASFYVFLGGEVTPETGQTPGTYTKEITLTAEYN
ncbi:MAG: DUF4402 domain-containing protein [Bacteroidales bacterium]